MFDSIEKEWAFTALFLRTIEDTGFVSTEQLASAVAALNEWGATVVGIDKNLREKTSHIAPEAREVFRKQFIDAHTRFVKYFTEKRHYPPTGLQSIEHFDVLRIMDEAVSAANKERGAEASKTKSKTKKAPTTGRSQAKAASKPKAKPKAPPKSRTPTRLSQERKTKAAASALALPVPLVAPPGHGRRSRTRLSLKSV